MRIKSLQVHGFKSFVDRTVFEFQPGVTAVVGPNGCGKSNVVDAVRWVMGEQSPRRLRGKVMDDIIFAGSEGRAPIGMAEVILTFDNEDGTAPPAFADYAEIQLARRLYRSGESEYLINRTQCRLRDIQDFFRDTGIGVKGYTIVEQGRIAEIVSARPEDRRVLIEEAAGISKYKARRREAEGKIASTEQNLVRISDVLGEINRQIASSSRQARKAARYKRFQETSRILELSIAAEDRADRVSAAERAGRRLRDLRDEAAASEAGLAEREIALEERRIAAAEAEKAVSRGAEALYALRSEVRDLEGGIALGRRESEGIVESNAGRREERTRLEEQLEAAQAAARGAGEELERIEQALAVESQTLATAEAEARSAARELAALTEKREAANQVFVEVLTALARAEDRRAAIDDRRAELEQRLRSANQELELQQSEASQVEGSQRHLEEGLRNLLAERDRFQDKLIQALHNVEAAEEGSRIVRERLREEREGQEGRKARLASLREWIDSHEDLAAGTKHVLAGGAEVRSRLKVRGLVRELIEADPAAERAVEAVLAERAEAVVVENARGALQALEELRRQEKGRGLFLVEPPPEPASVGIVPLGEPLLDRVRARPGFEGVARGLLGGVNLVEDLSQVLSVYGDGRLPAVFVTPAGDVLSRDGLLSGGGAPSRGGSLSRLRDVRELERAVSERARALEDLEIATRESDAQLSRAKEALENLRNRHHTAALAVANHEKDLERTRERVKAIGEAREGRTSERSELLAELEARTEEREGLEARIAGLRADRTTSQHEVDALGLEISSAGRESSRLETRATELRVAGANRSRERDRLTAALASGRDAARETQSWIERREREIRAGDERRAALADELRRFEAELGGVLVEEEKARIASQQLRERFDAETRAVREIEGEVRAARGNLGGLRDAASSAELAVRESELELRHLDEGVRERWQIDLASWQPPEVDAEAPPQRDEAEPEEGDVGEGALDPVQVLRDARQNAELATRPREERQRLLEDLRARLQALGEVNLGAIEEHEELAERARFLGEQKQDLEHTIVSLREAIARINRTSRRRFRETFEAVAKRFSENFPRMFGGGKASLALTEAEDVLEAGIDIMAQPPGKRLQNVNLLSGGEKTMTAIALLVAVFQVRPSPFFLLDEVDAALDDANVGRFNQLITELAATSQFLVITHNKRTIEVADVLYGVTMEQKGVSKLVTVELH